MRVRLDFELSQPVMGQNYRYAILSFVKAILNASYPEEYKKNYETSMMKGMTFAAFFPRGKIFAQKIEAPDKRMNVLFSGCDQEFLAKLYNAAIKSMAGTYPFPGGTSATLRSAKMEFPPQVQEEHLLIRFLSPLLVRVHSADGKDTYLDYSDPAFEAQLNESVRLLTERLSRGDLASCAIRLTPVHAKKTVVKSDGLAFTANLGTFRLSGSRELLQFLYQTGIGSRRSEGFGMWDIVASGGKNIE